jgi:proteasome lid subunit RPN8/RPN11
MLVLPDARRAELTAWIRAGYPHETCGLLIGRSAAGQREAGEPEAEGGKLRTEVVRVAQARNLNSERARDRYELDPADFMQADLAAREDGLEIVGVWHSHPDHPAEPSETDRAAAWEGWSYVIATVTADGVTAVRSWRLEGEHFAEEALTS